jgi:hypothetical protein
VIIRSHKILLKIEFVELQFILYDHISFCNYSCHRFFFVFLAVSKESNAVEAMPDPNKASDDNLCHIFANRLETGESNYIHKVS